MLIVFKQCAGGGGGGGGGGWGRARLLIYPARTENSEGPLIHSSFEKPCTSSFLSFYFPSPGPRSKPIFHSISFCTAKPETISESLFSDFFFSYWGEGERESARARTREEEGWGQKKLSVSFPRESFLSRKVLSKLEDRNATPVKMGNLRLLLERILVGYVESKTLGAIVKHVVLFFS